MTADTAPSGSTPPRRIGSLDSLRGIAALVVVFYHLALVVPGIYPRLLTIHALRLPLAAGPAVYVFFVLSGFVLYLSLERHDRDGWFTFAARRLMRLWPPVAAAVLLSAALYLLVSPEPIPALRGWFNDLSWNGPLSPGVLAAHLLLLDAHRFQMLDNPMWSLVVEVRLSLVFPLLAAGVRRRSFTTLLGCAIISAVARHVVAAEQTSGAIDPALTLQFLDLFAVGAVMARHRETVARVLGRMPGPLVAAAIVLGLIEQARLYPYVMYASAILLVAASFSFPSLARVYGVRPLVWLGERSFSLYLVHLPVLLTAVYMLDGQVPIAAILGAVVPLSLLTAELFWLAVERPSIALTRRVGGGVRRGAGGMIVTPLKGG